jgi:hypothetical protein
MTTLDYLLLGAFAAGVLYIGYRLLIGWLRTPPHENGSETSNMSKRFAQPRARERGLASEAVAEVTDMPSRMR